MSEKINDKTVFSLLEVTGSIQKTLNDRYKSSFWVKAEMNKLNFYKHSGHCYPELVEKKDGKVIAQIKSYIWKDDYFRINRKFIDTLNEPLKDGIKILFQVKITFDPAHGLSLWITDIDPGYTLGDLEREKQETVSRLKNEGIFNKNKTLSIPLLPQRIAVISVETSKGYADFLKVIETNSWGYRFFMYLFPSLLQGENAVQSIIEQLEKIKKVKHHFDVVAIIRGGGGDVGLSCFNSYKLAEAIALFPIPVITGIGHATNETVTEMIAFSNAITPTKLAEYLLQKFHDFSGPVHNAEKKITEKAARLLNEEKMKFGSEAKLFRSVTDNILISNSNAIVNLMKTLSDHALFTFKNENDCLETNKTNIVRGATVFCNIKKIAVVQLKEKLQLQSMLQTKNSMTELNSTEKNIANMNPVNVLKRGYSITRLNGKSVKSISQVRNGDILDTLVHEGNITSIVNSTRKTINDER
ncbi:MAG: exodeoxyribonuclease VII large subunit [Prevotellaceae bacterium]|jgi:exodeoxyribonuclease VII large subunit|nr:exodeoxyribonuclease VII large subunit [Prevotellaceae bacterium]